MSEKVHVLYIDCHDLGDWLGCYGRDYVNTPNIDRLAESGVRFDQHYSTAPICMPSRVSMYAGLYPHEAGCLGQMPYDEDTPMMAQVFRDAGYRTINCGWNTKDSPQWAGYDQTASVRPHQPDAPKVIDQLAGEETDRPFFAHFSFGHVHRPLRCGGCGGGLCGSRKWCAHTIALCIPQWYICFAWTCSRL